MKFSLLRYSLALSGLSLLLSEGSCASQDEARIELESPEREHFIPEMQWQRDLLRRVEVLSADSLEGRAFGTEGGALAREYLIEQFDAVGLGLFGDSRTQEVTINSDSGANIVGELRSQTLSDSSRTILIGAHYDHEGIKGGKVYNGADDNASGTSLLLAIADTLSKSTLKDVRFVFVAFDAEERGLVGAKNFVESNIDLIDQVDLMINFDMVSISDSEELYVAGTHHYPNLSGIVSSLEEVATFTVLKGHDIAGGKKQDWTFSSDHGPFHSAGTPFLYFGVEDHEHYHQPSDKYAVIDKEFYIRVADSFRQLAPNIESLL